MAEDHLKNLPLDQVAGWYRRLADAWSANTPDLHPPLAGAFLRAWVNNRNPKAAIQFDAPPHLRTSSAVLDTLLFHREVFLTIRKARIGGGEKWAGLLPRIQGAAGFTKWDMKGDLPLEYESLCDIAPNVLSIAKIQRLGSSGDRDLLGSLRGFQLKSRAVAFTPQMVGNMATIQFRSWTCSASDRYDWNYAEHFTVANPDYQSQAPDAVRPQDQTLTVFHSNAKRLEVAAKAAPFDVVLRPWTVADPRITGPANVDTSRRL